jgi:ubiquinone/menaquinone biosynthesis C-methylase UbiE
MGAMPMEKPDLKKDFDAVDQATSPASFIKCLDTVSDMNWFKQFKRRTFDLLAAHKGSHLLDVGCGTGDDVRMLAQRVGQTGKVVGVDNSAAMITEAQKRTADLDLPIEYLLGDAHQLEFADNTFDGCRSERTFQHLDSPHRALLEMVRVTRPGGWVVVADPDWETFTLAANDEAVTRKIMNLVCDTFKNRWIGRQLPPLFRELGLADITVVADTLLLTDYTLVDQIWGLQTTVERAQAAGIITAEEGACWLRDLDQRNQTGRFFGSVTAFIVAGRKPK